VLLCAAAFAAVASSCGHNGKLTPTPDAGNPLPEELCLDNDGDGYPGTGDGCSTVEDVDCNDDDPTIHPQAAEVCNGVDDNCNGQIDEGLAQVTYYVDHDGDGVGATTPAGMGCGAPPMGEVTATGDCDDNNAAVHPGAAELCNGVDDNCDGQIDNGIPFQNFYPDRDGDGFGDATAMPTPSCQTSVMGMVPNNSDCDDTDPTVHPGATELCNKRDDNCDGQVDNGITYLAYYVDADGDGHGAQGTNPEMACAPVPGKSTVSDDCDDTNPAVHPGATEICNGIDDNCNGMIDEGLTFTNYYPDVDGDGYGATGVTPVSSCVVIPGKVTQGGDCNDTNASIHPGAAEVCNGVDDNCNGMVDEGLTFTNYYVDADGDGYGAGTAQSSCAPVPGKVTNNQDCNDANPAVKPGAAEVCNGIDDNCNGQVDDGLTFTNYYPDADGDGYGNKLAMAQSACAPVSGKVTNNTDCDDSRFGVHPGATEVCNGLDDNCNGMIDEGLTFTNYYPDVDSDGYGSSTAQPQSSCAPVPGKVTDHTDCNDAVSTIHPGAPETCNGVDDNCDGLIDNGTVTQNYYPDVDGDGYGASGSSPIASCAPVSGRVANNTDCNDANNAVHPGATEVCNGVDDNCNGMVDEGLTFLNYYPDVDGDGFGSSSAAAQSACAAVAGKVTSNTDCNDANAAVHPGATEICNQLDDNCNGMVDEGLATQAYYPDMDGDGFGAAGSAATQSCGPLAGKVTNNTDCNDANPAVKPNAVEVCNGIDDNCNGMIDEGNPGGGAACSTGQVGVCAAGTKTCTAGSLQCVRNVAPSTEKCNGLDDDCNGQTDETFTDKGTACTNGLGVCLRSGTKVCKLDGSGTQCNVDAGNPTPPACDGLDNDCDGIVDEPYLSSTYNIATPTPWADIEVAPFYYSASGCAGGVNGAGTDALVGGAMAMGVGADGLYLQLLDTAGAPVGALNTAESAFPYNDVALAQAGQGFILAGAYSSAGYGWEIDLYYMDGTTGQWLAQNWSLFHSDTNAIDSLRVVRGNGKRVTVIWREASVGVRWFRVEPTWNATTSSWDITQVGGATLDTTTLPNTLVAGTGILPGIGADSSAWDWDTVQTCVATSTLQEVAVAYRPSSTNIHYFTMKENATSKSAETDVRTGITAPASILDPDVTFYRSGSANHYFIAYVMDDPTNAWSDLELWYSASPGYNYAWFDYATTNGAASIVRPRGSATASQLWVSALRYVTDASGFTRQVMTRTLDFSGNRLPSATNVELPVTNGACSGDPPCRGGNKDGFTNWAPFGRVYYSAFGATPTGAFASTLTCQ
jgi:hypothetical protein